MHAQSPLTPLERELGLILTYRLRLLGADQAQSLVPEPERLGVTRAIAALVRKGLCEQTHLVVAVPDLQTWLLRSDEPELAAKLPSVVWQLATRVRQACPLRRKILWATPLALKLLGGVGGRPRQPLQIEHDLGVAATYFRRRTLDPTGTQRWVGEDRLRQFLLPGVKVPDAVLVNHAGQIERAIEYGGQYSRARLEAFCQYCHTQTWSFEIW